MMSNTIGATTTATNSPIMRFEVKEDDILKLYDLLEESQHQNITYEAEIRDLRSQIASMQQQEEDLIVKLKVRKKVMMDDNDNEKIELIMELEELMLSLDHTLIETKETLSIREKECADLTERLSVMTQTMHDNSSLQSDKNMLTARNNKLEKKLVKLNEILEAYDDEFNRQQTLLLDLKTRLKKLEHEKHMTMRRTIDSEDVEVDSQSLHSPDKADQIIEGTTVDDASKRSPIIYYDQVYADSDADEPITLFMNRGKWEEGGVNKHDRLFERRYINERKSDDDDLFDFLPVKSNTTSTTATTATIVTRVGRPPMSMPSMKSNIPTSILEKATKVFIGSTFKTSRSSSPASSE